MENNLSKKKNGTFAVLCRVWRFPSGLYAVKGVCTAVDH